MIIILRFLKEVRVRKEIMQRSGQTNSRNGCRHCVKKVKNVCKETDKQTLEEGRRCRMRKSK
jgi:hypothetical protein